MPLPQTKRFLGETVINQEHCSNKPRHFPSASVPERVLQGPGQPRDRVHIQGRKVIAEKIEMPGPPSSNLLILSEKALTDAWLL